MDVGKASDQSRGEAEPELHPANVHGLAADFDQDESVGGLELVEWFLPARQQKRLGQAIVFPPTFEGNPGINPARRPAAAIHGRTLSMSRRARGGSGG